MKRKLTVTVPPGVDESHQMRLRDEGEAGIYGGSPGDVYIALSIKPHEFFVRKDTDILYELPINFAQAALGNNLEVPTLDGQTELKIPPGIQNGKVLRIKGKGVTRLHGKNRGDQLVIIRVVTPQPLDDKQRQLFEELANTLPEAEMPEGEDQGILGRLKSLFGDN